MRVALGLTLLLGVLAACSRSSGTAPPPEGWANAAPTLVERVVDRADAQLLEVSQGKLKTWVKVPAVGAKAGDYILLGQGAPRDDVEIPELKLRAEQIVDIAHARVVDRETAERAATAQAPEDAVPIGTLYAELATRADAEVVVYGTVVKSTGAIGYYWVHLRDGSGDPDAGTHDLTVKTDRPATEGLRIAYRGTLRADVDLGFGYHYDALVEDARPVD